MLGFFTSWRRIFLQTSSTAAPGVDTTLTFLPCHPYTEVVDCCGGIALCRSSRYEKDYYVCSPATKSFAVLPPCPSSFYLSSMWLYFDPMSSPHYKVIWAKSKWMGNSVDIEFRVFSSEKRSWGEPRAICVSVGVPDHGLCRIGVVCNRALYIADYRNCIVRIDLNRENHCVIKLPYDSTRPIMMNTLGRFGGELCYFDLYGSRYGNRLRIWVLGEDDGSPVWELKHRATLKYDQVSNGYPARCLAHDPYLEILYILREGRVLAYDHRSESLEDVCWLGKETQKVTEARGLPFFPCLLDVLDVFDDEETSKHSTD